MSLRNFLKKSYFTLYKRHFYGITSPIRVLPDFIVIGVGRGGTTSLYHYLGQHPCIAKSAYDELGFFDTNYELGLNWYRSMFPTKLTKRSIEKKHGKFLSYEVTPSYIRRPWVAERISKILPNIKLIAILRNPIDKTYSHYNMSVTEGSQKLSFEDAIKEDMQKLESNVLQENEYFHVSVENSYLARGFYAEQLQMWFNLFPKERLYIISTEDLSSKTNETLNSIFDFLQLPHYKISDLDRQRVGKYPLMNPETRRLLIDYFKPHNEKLYLLLGKRFNWDN